MASLLPQAVGLMPKWIGLVGAIALINGVTALFSGKGAREIYDKIQPTDVSPLAHRLFGTWTFTSGIVRLYTAYNIDDPALYQMTLWSFGIAFFHFMSEFLAFKSLGLNRASISPMIVSSVSFVWMWNQRNFYLG